MHAYTRSYGGGVSSTRVKDLVDIVLIKSFATLDANRLGESLHRTFEIRGQQSVPVALPPPAREWDAAYRKLAKEVGQSPDLADVHAEAAALVDPVLAGLARAQWDPVRSVWVEL